MMGTGQQSTERGAAGRGGGDVVVTGAGLVSCLGLDRRTTWRAVCEGRSGIASPTKLEQQPSPDKGVGQAPPLPEDEAPSLPREARYLRRALREAIEEANAGATIRRDPQRCGLFFGTTLHGMRAAGQLMRGAGAEPLRTFLPPATLNAAAGDLGIEGLAVTTCSACSSGLGAVAMAVMMIQAGEIDLAVAGGYDPLSEYAYAGFNSLGLIASGPSRPFCRDREGMKLAEGYGVVVLERAPDAERRGAAPRGVVLGYGESADAFHLSQPDPEGGGASGAMRSALRDGGVPSDHVGLIAAHATGTPDNDLGEHAALLRTFGDRLAEIPLVAFKSHIGHTLGGAGAAELVLSLTALEQGTVPPTANVTGPELEYQPLRVITGQPLETPTQTVLNVSLGFGGANTALLLGAPGTGGDWSGTAPAEQNASAPAPHVEVGVPSDRSPSSSQPERAVAVTGMGVVFPNAVGNEAFTDLVNNPEAPALQRDTGEVDAEALRELLSARRIRRMSDHVKLALAAGRLALTDAGLDPDAGLERPEAFDVLLASTHGSATHSSDYYQQIVEEGMNAANPVLFAEAVPNAGAAHLSLALGLKGACQTLLGTRTAVLDALRLAAHRIAFGRCERVIVGAAEEYASLVRLAYRHFGLYARRRGGEPFFEDAGHGFFCGSGAVCFLLESEAAAAARGARPHGFIERAAGGQPALAAADGVGQTPGADEVPGARRRVRLLRRVLGELGDPPAVIGSANGTWIDRIERAGLRRPCAGEPPPVTSLYGYIAETFSVTPAASVAAALLTGRLPALRGGASQGDGLRPAGGFERPGSFAIIATDYAGPIAGVRVAPAEDRS